MEKEEESKKKVLRVVATAAAKDISVNAAMVAVLSELDGVLILKKTIKTALRAFAFGKHYETFLRSKSYVKLS